MTERPHDPTLKPTVSLAPRDEARDPLYYVHEQLPLLEKLLRARSADILQSGKAVEGAADWVAQSMKYLTELAAAPRADPTEPPFAEYEVNACRNAATMLRGMGEHVLASGISPAIHDGIAATLDSLAAKLSAARATGREPT